MRSKSASDNAVARFGRWRAEYRKRRDMFRCGTGGPGRPRCAIFRPMNSPATASKLRTIRFGHSPDADDAYMFYGFHAGLAEVTGCRVEHVLQDIQSLNRRAIESAD